MYVWQRRERRTWLLAAFDVRRMGMDQLGLALADYWGSHLRGLGSANRHSLRNPIRRLEGDGQL